MRHHNPTNYGFILDKPIQSQYTDSFNRTGFAKANSSKRYVKALQYINDHDGCKRVNINIALFGWNRDMKLEKNDIKKIAYWSRGQHSNMYSQLLYIDVIDYDKNFRYHITDKGREVLKNAYLNDMAKIVKGK